ncbi:MAG: hypothetical protein HQL30_03755 [Candidatus Omnitrophica bacterium]|nr:hypothetical protein [Candidatus Omnitrophota bacterium]
MKILTIPISVDELKIMSANMFGDMVKAVVDTERELVAVDADLHSDLEALLLADGSRRKNLWGVNFYPDVEGDDFVEIDSMINLRPSEGNMSRWVKDGSVRRKIISVVAKWVER